MCTEDAGLGVKWIEQGVGRGMCYCFCHLSFSLDCLLNLQEDMFLFYDLGVFLLSIF